nr:hypothetical protein GZ26B2_12 [uncultured archaeon GZfos26B2]
MDDYVIIGFIILIDIRGKVLHTVPPGQLYPSRSTTSPSASQITRISISASSGLMRHHRDRLPHIPEQLPEQLKNLPRRDAIRIRGRLVGKANLWLVDERPRNRKCAAARRLIAPWGGGLPAQQE